MVDHRLVAFGKPQHRLQKMLKPVGDAGPSRKADKPADSRQHGKGSQRVNYILG